LKNKKKGGAGKGGEATRANVGGKQEKITRFTEGRKRQAGHKSRSRAKSRCKDYKGSPESALTKKKMQKERATFSKRVGAEKNKKRERSPTTKKKKEKRVLVFFAESGGGEKDIKKSRENN